MKNMTKFEYSKKISEERNKGKIDEAISVALEARNNYPDENIFEKFLGDLYFKKMDFALAGDSYINFLSKIETNVQYIKHFANFLRKYLASVNEEEASIYISKVENSLKNTDFDTQVLINLCEILAPHIEIDKLYLFRDDRYFSKAVSYIQEVEKTYLIYIVYYKILYLEHLDKNKRIDKYVVSSMEKKGQYAEALQLIEKVLQYDTDQVAVRTLFRICRKLDDYTAVEEYIKTHEEIKKVENFNVLYELVFYYSKSGDILGRNEALKKIEKCGNDSIPIMRTLYNFYLQFGMLDKAAETNSKIVVLKKAINGERKTKDREQQEQETALELIKMMSELLKEREHSRKIVSMSELLKGFSHELGQPITNIRYSIQLYQMEMKMGVDTKEELNQLFDDILSQTLRIKSLLSRFSPIVTEKNNISDFSVQNKINDIFREFGARLAKEDIKWTITAETDFTICGDSVKFDQIFYNLIGNAIYAIKEKGVPGNINVHIAEQKDIYLISFQDNGTGIAPEYLDKIFEPFFTTKEKERDENGGGEGLGLYIIWNIVRMFDGNIRVDKKFKGGARFIIEISKKEDGKDFENE